MVTLRHVKVKYVTHQNITLRPLRLEPVTLRLVTTNFNRLDFAQGVVVYLAHVDVVGIALSSLQHTFIPWHVPPIFCVSLIFKITQSFSVSFRVLYVGLLCLGLC